MAGLIGGGTIPRPGEVTLSHRGVLFLDELPEFPRSVLEVLRQPLEDREVHISRVNASFVYPSDFILIAAMNPCPCGYLGDPQHQCTCTDGEIRSYGRKISGPLLDRIDLHVTVQRPKYKELIATTKGRILCRNCSPCFSGQSNPDIKTFQMAYAEQCTDGAQAAEGNLPA